MLNWSSPQPAAESSSLPSGQSLSPSQSQRLGTQAYDPGQLNSPGAHVTEPGRKNRITCSGFKKPKNTKGQTNGREDEVGDAELKQMVLLRWYLLLSVCYHF